MTLPLLLDASGKKFGKSESGAVWLDAELTAPYDFFQYFVRLDDRDVITALRFLTTLDRPTIEGLEAAHAEAPQRREAHHALARFMTQLVHGEAEARKAEAAAQALFTHQAGALPPGTPTFDIPEGKLACGWPLVDALVDSGLLPSKGAARREIQGGGIYVNDARVGSVEHSLGVADLQDGQIRLRKGKKSHLVLRLP